MEYSLFAESFAVSSHFENMVQSSWFDMVTEKSRSKSERFAPSCVAPQSTTKTMQHSHKAGALKQVNKSHKQSKASKRSIKLKSGGRVEAGEKMSMKMKWV